MIRPLLHSVLSPAVADVSEKHNLTFTFVTSSWTVLSTRAKQPYSPTYILDFTHLTVSYQYSLNDSKSTVTTVQLIYVWILQQWFPQAAWAQTAKSNADGTAAKGIAPRWWSFSYPSLCFPSLLYSGPLAYCCGRYSLWDTCPTLAKVTRRFWSLSPMEEGWIHLKTALALCMRF